MGGHMGEAHKGEHEGAHEGTMVLQYRASLGRSTVPAWGGAMPGLTTMPGVCPLAWPPAWL